MSDNKGNDKKKFKYDLKDPKHTSLEEEAYNTGGCRPKEPNCTATRTYYYERLSDADDTNEGYVNKDEPKA